MSNAPRDYQPHLDGLRAIAVLAVIAFHAGLGLSGGFVGVDAFFVISGYLILGQVWKALAERSWSLADFWRRRLRRIVPAVTVVTAATLLTSYWWMPPDALQKAAQIGLAQQVAAANVWLWATANSYFAHENHWQPLLHLWSLGVEEQFYLVAPLLLWLLFQFGRKVAFAGLALAAAASLATSIAITPTRPFDAFYLPHARFWELTLGGLFAIAVYEGWWPRLRAARGLFAVGGTLLLLGSMVWFTERTAIPGAMALLPCLGALLLIAAGQGSPDHPAARVLSLPVLRYFGLRSYSLYLWHWPCLVMLEMRCAAPLTARLLAFAAMFLLTELSYRFVEQPLRRAPRSDSLGRVLVTTLAVSGALAFACHDLYASNGAKNRAPELYDHAPRPELHCHPLDVSGLPANPMRDLLHVGFARTIGNAASYRYDYAVLGDSHARFATHMFHAMGTAYGVRGILLGMDGVAPVAGAWAKVDAGKREHPGYRWSQLAMATTIEARPKVVFLVARWSAYTRFALANGGMLILDPANQVEADPAAALSALGAGLRETVREFHAQGIAVAFVGQAPEHANHHADLFRHLLFGYPLKPPTSDQWQHADRLQARLQTALGPDGSALRWIAPNLPAAPEQLLFWEGASIYWDGDHLSLHGLRTLLAEPCRTVLREALQSPR